MNAPRRRTRVGRWRIAVLVAGWPCVAPAGEIVSNLVAAFDHIETVQCDVRRETITPAGRGRKLSRVVFQRPDRLFVENFAPLRRRIVCDGTNFHSYVEGDPMGFARAVADLPDEMRWPLRVVPGSPMDPLLRLIDKAETVERCSEDGRPAVVAINGPPYGRLHLDETGRVARIEIYGDVGRSNLLAHWSYHDFRELALGAWIPLRHETTLVTPEGELRETSHFENYRVGVPPDPEIFQASRHFRGAAFTNSFDAIYRSTLSP